MPTEVAFKLLKFIGDRKARSQETFPYKRIAGKEIEYNLVTSVYFNSKAMIPVCRSNYMSKDTKEES